MKGIDISRHQKGLKIVDVKNAGIDFVIIRGGYTGYGADRTKQKDSCFESFYQQAKDLGLSVGAYWYSCARNSADGIAEATFFYENCLKGKHFEFPVYIDVEDSHWQAKDKKGVTDAIIAFCDYLEKKGFYVGIYASKYWFDAKIDTARLNNYSKWVASWSNAKPVVKFNGFDMWQDSDNGRIAHIRVDTDQAFVDFPNIIKKAGKNGFAKGEKPKETAPEDTIHIVKAGETLSGIAKKYKTTVSALVKKNSIKDKNKIVVGQKIRI